MSDGDIVRVGILSVQGDFAEHEESFREAARAQNSDVAVVRVRLPADLPGLHGLVLPGGESTVMSRFLRRYGLAQSVRDWMRGTCTLLLSEQVFQMSNCDTKYRGCLLFRLKYSVLAARQVAFNDSETLFVCN